MARIDALLKSLPSHTENLAVKDIDENNKDDEIKPEVDKSQDDSFTDELADKVSICVAAQITDEILGTGN